MPVVRIPAGRITNWSTFHDVFNEVLEFPAYYGRNVDAWIDCLTYVDDPESGMTRVTVGVGDVLTLPVEGGDEFARHCPEQ
jgi:hypothetical protein